MKTAVFTIASKNYFAYVRTIMQSLELSNPHMERFAVVVDELDDEFVALPRNFRLLELDKLDLPHPNQMKFRYNIMELNTAVKPFAILKLFETYDRVIYFDPDIYVYKKLEPVEAALDGESNFVLTPHFSGLFEDDGLHPDEPDIMRTGVYNLGFIALNKCHDTVEMVTWWANKLEKQCINAQSEGIFVDQKWIDLVPGFYNHVCILRHPGLNVAYWNLSHRRLTEQNGEVKVNGEPLIFFHFSGFDPNNIETISKYQNRYMLKDLGKTAGKIFETYSETVLSNEFNMWKKFVYSFNLYTDGRKVLEEHRKKYRNEKRIQGYCGENPFKYADIFYGDKKIEFFKDGVNLVGYIRSEHGLGEAARLTADCLEATDIKWSAFDFEYGNNSRKGDNKYKSKIEQYIKYDVSILNINADQFSTLHHYMPSELWDTYKIGIWYWELPEFPEKWMKAFVDVDEIWAPTKFIADCLKKCAPCPVYHMPPGIHRTKVNIDVYNREFYGLPNDAFLFLNMFDVYSFSGRKNPEAVVNAFKSAFSPDDMSVGLVLKLNNSGYTDEIAKKLQNLIEGYQNIYIIAETLSRDAVNGLVKTCDVAVSLHRSEGLGLLCEEAMYYGKPVIATGWSGNMDFMTGDNSCLVKYELHEIGEDIGPYEAWQKWASPDITQAAEYMKRLVAEPQYYEVIANAAKETILGKFSPEVCGEKMKNRLIQIRKNMVEEEHRDIARITESFKKSCVYYFEKAIDKRLSEEEKDEISANWVKEGIVDFGEIAADLRKYGFAMADSDREFIVKVYQVFLERMPGEQEILGWSNYLRKENKVNMISAVLKSNEFLCGYAKIYNKTVAQKRTPNPSNVLAKELNQVNLKWKIPYYFDLKSKGPKLFLKRIIRKTNRFLLQPILEGQQEFNAHVVRTLNEINRKLIEVEIKESALEKRVETNPSLDEIDSRFNKFTQLIKLSQKELLDFLNTKISEREATMNTVLDEVDSKFDTLQSSFKLSQNELIDCLKEKVDKISENTEHLKDSILEVEGSRHNQLVHYFMELIEEKNRNDLHDNKKWLPLLRESIKEKWNIVDTYEQKYNNQSHIITCPICNKEFSTGSVEIMESECIFNGGRLIRYKCPGCGVIFGPEKMFALTEKQFSEDYALHYSAYKEGDSTKQELELFYKLNPSKSGVYLDWGAGAWSTTIETLREEGYQVYGYDPYAPTDSEYVIKELSILQQMKFDGIFSHDLLEHLRDPLGTFKLFAQIIKPEGKMIHSTACYDYVYEYTRFHLFFYTGQAITQLCKKAGFCVDNVERDAVNLLISYSFSLKND